jgi:hypothetical protein
MNASTIRHAQEIIPAPVATTVNAPYDGCETVSRLQAITDALEIIGKARLAVYSNTPAAWEFLWRVTRYLTEQQKQAFQDAFGEAGR